MHLLPISGQGPRLPTGTWSMMDTPVCVFRMVGCGLHGIRTPGRDMCPADKTWASGAHSRNCPRTGCCVSVTILKTALAVRRGRFGEAPRETTGALADLPDGRWP